MSGDSTLPPGLSALFEGQLDAHLAAILRGQEQLYEQVEALLALYAQFEFRAMLPPMRKWAISPDFARILVQQIRVLQPALTVELGGGVSTLITAYALEQHRCGRVVAFDHALEYAERTRQQLTRHSLDHLAELRHAPLTAVDLPQHTGLWYDPAAFADLHNINLLIVDGPPQFNNPTPQARYPALPLLIERLAPGARILLDDAARPDEKTSAARWQTEFGLTRLAEFDTEKGAILLEKPA